MDDSKVKDFIRSEEDVLKLQNELDKINKWENKNNINFNPDKFELLHYGKDNDLKKIYNVLHQ